MKKFIFLFIRMTALALLAFAEPGYRKTTADMYQESYLADMRRHTGMSAAEIRAEEYRARYELCDEYHNCTNQTAESKKQLERKETRTDSRPENVMPFIHVPIWQ